MSSKLGLACSDTLPVASREERVLLMKHAPRRVLKKRGGRERTVEARKGGARTYKVLVDWPLMEILCLLAFDSLPPLPQLFMMMDDGHPALLGDPAQ